jgi:hypothetical protein
VVTVKLRTLYTLTNCPGLTLGTGLNQPEAGPRYSEDEQNFLLLNRISRVT